MQPAALLPRAFKVVFILTFACIARLTEIAGDIGLPFRSKTRRGELGPLRALATAKIHSNATHASIST